MKQGKVGLYDVNYGYGLKFRLFNEMLLIHILNVFGVNIFKNIINSHQSNTEIS